MKMFLRVLFYICGTLILQLAMDAAVNQHSPKFDYFIVENQVFENGQISKPLNISPKATDLDLGLDGTIKYSIIAGNGDHHFSINQKTGVISMEQSLDRERKSRYQLTVLAIDQGSPPRTGSATVRITVLDQNDNPPSCISRVSADVRETAPLSQVVASLTCSDDDEAVNAVSTYQITPKGNQHYLPFRVSQYGNVLVATPLAYVSNSVVKGSPNSNVFTFGVTVRNTAYPFLKTSVMVTLNVTEAACPNPWDYQQILDHKLGGTALTSLFGVTRNTCQFNCSDVSGCKSFNWIAKTGTCEMMGHTNYTDAKRFIVSPGTVFERKHCTTDFEPAPVVKRILTLFPRDIASITSAVALNTSERLAAYSRQPDDQTHVDVWTAVGVLQSLVASLNHSRRHGQTAGVFAKTVTETVSNLLQPMYNGIWTRVIERRHRSSSLLTLLEEMNNYLLKSESLPVDIDTKRVKTSYTRVGSPGDQHISVRLTQSGGQSGVLIPADDLPPGEPYVHVIVSVFEDFDKISKSLDIIEANTSVLVGHVVSVIVRPPTAAVLSTPILLEIQTPRGNYTNVESRRCVFLDTKPAETAWRTHGCKLHAFNTTHTTCACNHLTNFAVLMQVTNLQLPKAVRVSLEVLTVMGCTVSIAALSTTIAVHVWLRMRSERVILLLNLSGALVVAQIVFLAGVDATSNKATCQAVAILLHYLFLSVFTLMLAEGVQLYVKMCLVFRRDRNVLPFILAAWSLPLLIVGLSVGLNVSGYGTPFSCWLSIEEGTIWAFVGPVLAIVAFNIFVLGLVIKTFLNLKINARKTECQKLISSVKAAAVLLPLLGITWMFGVAALDSSTLAFQYLFALLNSFQGLFMFVVNVVYNNEVQVAYGKRRGRVQTVHSIHTHSTATISITEARRKVFAGFLSTHI